MLKQIYKIFFTTITLVFTNALFAMPPAVAVVSAGLGAVGSAVTLGLVAGTAATVVGALVVGAALYTGIKVLGMDIPEFQDNLGTQAAKALSNQQGNTNPLPVIYGERRVGGTPIFYEVTGDNNEYLHMVIAICEGEIEAIDNVFFNEEAIEGTYFPDIDDSVITFGQSTLYTGLLPKYKPFVELQKFLGKDSQTPPSRLTTETAWTSNDKLNGVAYVYLRLLFDPDVFGSTGIPQINFQVKGKKLTHPNSANTNKLFSTNPALCIFDYLTNNIYGRGIATSDIDTTSFISAATECDTLVTVGDFTQKKYTTNGLVQTNQTALKIIEQLLTSCRGSLVFTGGKYKLIIDSIGTAVQTFDESNIIGSYDLALGGKDFKTNEIQATFINPEKNYQGDFAIVKSSTFKTQDNNLTLKKSIELPFTDQFERAAMIATMNMKQSRQSLIISFTTTIVGLRAEVNDICYISLAALGFDSLNNNAGKKFRIMKLELQNDDEVKIVAREYDDDVYNFGTITAQDTSPNTALPNFSDVVKPVLATPTEELIFTNPNLFNRVTVTWSQTNNAYIQSYEIGVNRINSIHDTNRTSFDFTGRSNSEIFTIDQLEAGQYLIAVRAKNRLGVYSDFATTVFAVEDTSKLPAVNNAAITAVTEELFTTTQGSGVKAKAILNFVTSSNPTWEALGVNIERYEVEYKKTTDTSFVRAGSSLGTNFVFYDIEPSLYEFRIRAVNTAGVASEYSSYTQRIYGITAIPSDVSNFYLRADSNTATLSWTPTTDLDVKIGGSFEIRHSSLTSGAVWSNSVQIGEAVSGISNSTQVDLLVGTYLIKAVDSSGFKSATATSVVNTVTPDQFQTLVKTTTTESPTFSGTKTNMIVVDNNTLKLEADSLWDSLGEVDTLGLIDAVGGVDLTGSYQFANVLDTGAVGTYRIATGLTFTTDSTTDFFDARSGNIDTWDSIDINTYDDVELSLQIATTDDDPSGSPTYSDYQDFRIGNYYGRAFKFRMNVVSGDVTHQVYISALSASASAYGKIDSAQNTTSSSALSVSFGETFVATPQISITAHNMVSGDYYTISSLTTSGFAITFFNSSNSAIARTFDYLARGF